MKLKKLLSMIGIMSMIGITGISNTAHAHDTDIYVNSGGGIQAEPLVMFIIDVRSNLGATVCQGNECDSLVKGGYLASTPTTFFDLIRAVIKKVMDPLGGIRMGLMINHDTTTACAGPVSGKKCSNGAYILAGARSMGAGTDDPDVNDSAGEDANKLAFFRALDNIPTPQGNVAHAYQGKELYFEMFRYLTGQIIYNGHNGWTDFGTNNSYNLNDALDDGDGDTTKALVSWDTSVEKNPNSDPNGETYVSPLTKTAGSQDCTGLFAINLMFQVSQQEDESDKAIMSTKSNGGMAVGESTSDIIDLNGTNNTFNTVISWMNDIDLADGTFGTAENLSGKQNLTSYFLVDPTKINQTTNGYAQAGGTTRALPLSTDPAELEAEIASILRQILSVSTTFVAPSVAVNVYNRAQVQNDVFIAMFQAEEKGRPQWVGNVKKFNLGQINGVWGILDSAGKDAVNPNDGRVKAEALSYWTDPAELKDPQAGIDDYLAGADGRFVDRGGCGSRIPGYELSCTPQSGAKAPACVNNGTPDLANPGSVPDADGPRMVYTEPVNYPGNNGTKTALRNLNADSTTASSPDIMNALGMASAGTCTKNETGTACSLIKFMRGLNDDHSVRNWLMADPLHSRPLALNYGGVNKENPDIRIFVGGNDGMMRMLRNTDATATGPGPQNGTEGWAFAPLDTMGMVQLLKDNAPTDAHPYGVDGAPVAMVFDKDGTIDPAADPDDQAILFFGLRRGGRAYYALDVTLPDQPKMLWKISNKMTEYSELGQAWSTPVPGQMLVDGTINSTPVLIFAGGYDENKDTHGTGVLPDHTPAAGGPDSMGRGIFIVNALTGKLIWKAQVGASTGPDSANRAYTHTDMLHSIPSDVTAVDTDGNNLIDRIYVGDTGGNVWRVDARSPEPFAAGSEWTVSRVMSIANDDSGNPVDRRFFYAPDYVQTRDISGQSYDAIVIGTGDRADPLNLKVDNYFYVFKDKATNSGQPSSITYTHAKFGDVTDNCLQDGPCSTPPDLSNGWRMRMECPWQAASEPCGEKVLAGALTIDSTVYFTTYQPANGSATGTSCEPDEGTGYLYSVSLADGRAVFNNDSTNPALNKADRFEKSRAGGIPSGIVVIGGGNAMTPDLQVKEVGKNDGYRSYWFEKTKY